MKLVRDHLFIGNITDANAVIQTNELKISHMLSLLSNQILHRENPKPGDPYFLVSMRAGAHYPPLTKPADNPNPESPGGGSEADTHSINGEGREFVRMTVPLRDMESENLLDHLEACLEFIEEARKKGDILVHCLAGVSRSAAVITAYLMRTEKLSVDDALASLRQGSPHVCPNDGFMDQLKMFEEMGFKVDQESSIYKQFHVTNLASAGSTTSLRRPSFKNHVYNVVGGTSLRRPSFMTHIFNVVGQFKVYSHIILPVNYSLSWGYQLGHWHMITFQYLLGGIADVHVILRDAYGKGEKIESSRFASDPAADSPSLAESRRSQLKLHEENRVATLYRCRKCRRLVASESNVISHNSGVGEPQFRSKRRGGGRGHDDDYGEPSCSSIFVEPMQWMTAVIEGHVEGKLFCATCEARLGNFHWAGLQCSCGAWINPAFQLHKSRMDLTWT